MTSDPAVRTVWPSGTSRSAVRVGAEYPSISDLAVSAAGRVAFTLRPSPGEVGDVVVWPPTLRSDGAAVLPVAGHAPTWATDGASLAYVSDRSRGEVCIADDSDGTWQTTVLPVTEDGTVESVAWIPGSPRLLAVVAPPVNDGSVADGALRPEVEGWPEVRSTSAGHRRLVAVDVPGAHRIPMSPDGLSVWEAAGSDDGRVVAVVSEDPTETGWYDARLSLVDRQSEDLVYVSGWQLAHPAFGPGGGSIAAIEGWSSDRGHVAGDVLVIDLTRKAVTRIHGTEIGLDATRLEWVDERNLWVTGWRGVHSAWALVDIAARRARAGGVYHLVTEIARYPSSRQRAVVVTASAEGTRTIEVRALDAGDEPRVGVPGRSVIRWISSDGFEIEGLLVTDPERPRAEQRLIVMVHGGPANLWTDVPPEGAMALVSAGYAVLLPNPRGSVGRGQDFARANLADPGGGELEDLLSGASACRSRGLVEDAPPGIVGGSYGGYLTTCAAVFSAEVGAAVAMFGHPDLLSARLSSNNRAFYDRLLGGTHDGADMTLAFERSPVFHVSTSTPPVLLLHGDRDACTPTGQSEEMLGALAAASVESELVVYPGAGHGLRGHRIQTDVWTRVIDWFDRHLTAEHPC